MRWQGDDHLVFESTGREVYAWGKTIGLDLGHDEASYGWDGQLAEEGPRLTPEERRELAAYMISRWARFGEVG